MNYENSILLHNVECNFILGMEQNSPFFSNLNGGTLLSDIPHRFQVVVIECWQAMEALCISTYRQVIHPSLYLGTKFLIVEILQICKEDIVNLIFIEYMHENLNIITLKIYVATKFLGLNFSQGLATPNLNLNLHFGLYPLWRIQYDKGCQHYIFLSLSLSPHAHIILDTLFICIAQKWVELKSFLGINYYHLS